MNITYKIPGCRTPDEQYRLGLKAIYEDGVTQPQSVQGAPSRVLPWGIHMKFPIENGFPFDTLRNLKGAFHKFIAEALWILSGDTSLELLQKYGVDYWNNWCQPFQCERHGLKEGDFGATYGKQFRDFGSDWDPNKREFLGNGFDQLNYVIEGLKEAPHRRRWLITPFNPKEYDLVEIVPCHGELFFVAASGDLYLHLVQRSGDWPVGVPSNMVMWAFGGMVIAELTGLKFRGLSHFISNAHYYGDPDADPENRHEGDQTVGVKKLIARSPRHFPTVQIDDCVIDAVKLMLNGVVDPISMNEINPKGLSHPDFLVEHVRLTDYDPNPALPRADLPVSI